VVEAERFRDIEVASRLAAVHGGRSSRKVLPQDADGRLAFLGHARICPGQFLTVGHDEDFSHVSPFLSTTLVAGLDVLLTPLCYLSLLGLSFGDHFHLAPCETVYFSWYQSEAKKGTPFLL